MSATGDGRVASVEDQTRTEGVFAVFLVNENWLDDELRVAWNTFISQWWDAGMEPVQDLPETVTETINGWRIETYRMRQATDDD